MNTEYDIKNMKADLLDRLDRFLAGNLSQEELKTYAEDQFWKWDKVEESTLPPPNDDDRVYWAAIYDIWNLNDEPPEFHPGIEEMKLHRRCLAGEAHLPADVLAVRPARGAKGIEDTKRPNHTSESIVARRAKLSR